MIPIKRPINPVLFREGQTRRIISATLRQDDRYGAVIDWGFHRYEFPQLGPGQIINPEIIPLAGAIVMLDDGNFAFLDSDELAEKAKVENELAALAAQHYLKNQAKEREEFEQQQLRCRTANEALGLPFAWHPGYKPTLVGCYEGRRTNGSGATAATVSHVIVDEPIALGRLRRNAGSILCGAPPPIYLNGITHETFEDTMVNCRGCQKVIKRLRPQKAPSPA